MLANHGTHILNVRKRCDMLLFGRPSGVTSRRWTTCSLFSLSTKSVKRSFLMRPMGTTNALILAGAMGKRGSKLILAPKSFLQ